MKEFKVIKVDDTSWVACETIGKGIDFYLELTGVPFCELEVEECDVDEENAMWWTIDEFPKYKGMLDNMSIGDEGMIKGRKYGFYDGEPAKMVSYREAFELYGETLPYVIATCL